MCAVELLNELLIVVQNRQVVDPPCDQCGFERLVGQLVSAPAAGAMSGPTTVAMLAASGRRAAPKSGPTAISLGAPRFPPPSRIILNRCLRDIHALEAYDKSAFAYSLHASAFPEHEKVRKSRKKDRRLLNFRNRAE